MHASRFDPVRSGQRSIVHVVEDDDSSREATARFLRAAGHLVRTHRDGGEFLQAFGSCPGGCVVLDLLLPGTSGLEVQQALTRAEGAPPVVFLTAHGDVRRSVRAMKDGAVDFLAKADDGDALLDAVARALARHAHETAERERRQAVRVLYERLSPREREVFAHLISGQLNKQVGFDLGISEQTTKIHRHRILQKMEVDSIAELVRIAADLGIAPVGAGRLPSTT